MCYDPYFVQNKDEALSLCKTFVKTDMSVGLGGSTSVSEIGLLDYLINKEDITLFNQYEKGISMEENTNRRRLGMVTDLFVTGTNALTKDGKLINADGSGNRVAAMIFGPKKVLVIVGKNIDRMNSKAIEMGREPRHNLDNIANKFTHIKADEKDRIVLIIVNEDLGF
ncbi:lactate utilization protein [Sulfurimonas sp.]|uniref:lactate utilization protein n=1 Tax=Sulfurimonas sp. TaxID=2022749 RepID=UPI0025FA52EF|nr:lactate utilization protein [Sulfurimonas sp.]